MSAEFFPASERLLGAAANGVYQGMLVTLLAGLALRLFARTNAATRHAVWFGVLLFVTALIPAHLLLSSPPHPKIPASAIGPSASLAAIARAPSDSGTPPDWPAADSKLSDPQPDETNVADSDAPPVFPRALIPNDQAGTEIVPSPVPGTRPAGKPSPISISLRAVLKPLAQRLETAISLPHSVCLCLVAGWVFLAGLRAALIVVRIAEVRRVKSTARAPIQCLQTLFDKLRSSLAAGRNVRLGISDAHRNAVVLGFVHPVVLLPAEMDRAANEDEVEHVLRHELAHVDRRDDWGNLAQQLIQAALFFHPAVWWISSKLSLEREIACDDRVLDASPRPRAYALTLANIAIRMNHCRHLLAPGVSNNNSQLQQRITMILNTQRDRSPRLARSWLGIFTTATAMLAALAIAAGPRVVLAKSQPAAPAPAAEAPGQPALPPPPPQPGTAPEAPLPATASMPAAPEALPPSEPLLADATVSAAIPPDLSGPESAPRPKPPGSEGDYITSSSFPAAVGVAPITTSDGVALVAPVAPFGAVVGIAPVEPGAADEGDESDSSSQDAARPVARGAKKRMTIEERLDRIERMLNDLEARGTLKDHHRDDAFLWRGVPPSNPNPANMQADSIAAYKDFTAQAKKAAEQAQRAMEASQRDMERAADQAARELDLKAKDFDIYAKMGLAGNDALEKQSRELEQQSRDLEQKGREIEQQSKSIGRMTKDFQQSESKRPLMELQALRDARDSLNREIESLNRQIKRLEQQQNSPKQPGESNKFGASPKAETLGQPDKS
jgi:beta-lactamase regulating signal transducer with metallopeptidase domain/chaperonin cofactor prefoldin